MTNTKAEMMWEMLKFCYTKNEPYTWVLYSMYSTLKIIVNTSTTDRSTTSELWEDKRSDAFEITIVQYWLNRFWFRATQRIFADCLVFIYSLLTFMNINNNILIWCHRMVWGNIGWSIGIVIDVLCGVSWKINA